MNPEILIVGSGALATLFAARLSAAGVDVTMLGSWREGLAALRTNGACLEGEDNQRVRATDSPADCRGAKFALVLVKSWQTEHAARQLVDCLAEDSLAVTLQNGLGNDALLSALLGQERVSRGVTTLGATLVRPGVVRLGGDGVVTLEAHARLDAMADILRVANFKVSIVEDAQPVVWGKLMVNAAINPLTALLRVKNGELLANPQARSLMGELARETATVADSLGVKLSYLTPERTVEEVAQRTADNISSMLQDVLRGAQTEVDAINGAIVRTGELQGVSTPANRAVWSLVKALPLHGKMAVGPFVGGFNA
jgi:2-dehydropantoate 2-reductase